MYLDRTIKMSAENKIVIITNILSFKFFSVNSVYEDKPQFHDHDMCQSIFKGNVLSN